MDCGRVVFDLNIFRPAENTRGALDDNKVQSTHPGWRLSVGSGGLLSCVEITIRRSQTTPSLFIIQKVGGSNLQTRHKSFPFKVEAGRPFLKHITLLSHADVVSLRKFY